MAAMTPRLLLLLGCLVLGSGTGCSTFAPLKGGVAAVTGMFGGGESKSAGAPLAPATATATVPAAGVTPAGLPVASITQSENPAATSEQALTYERDVTTTVPTESEVRTETVKPDGGRVVVVETFPAGTTRTERVRQGVRQELGAAQKDTGREIAAKLSSYKGVQWAGIAALVCAAAMFHPAVRVAVGGGKSTQIAVGVVGLVLVFGPSLVVGNEIWFLAGGALFLAWHWFTSRSSYIEGKLDANHNGIPDEEERKQP